MLKERGTPFLYLNKEDRMKKKCILTALLAGLMVCLPTPSKAASPVRIWVKGNFVKSDVAPYVDQQRTMVPLRLVSENLGKKVIWEQENPNRIVISNGKEGKDYQSIVMTIDKTRVVLQLQGGEKHMVLDHAPQLRQNRTFVPLRHVAELFGEKVSWDQDKQVAIVGEGYSMGQDKGKEVVSSKDLLPYLYDEKMAQASLAEKIAYEKAMGKKSSPDFPGHTNKDVEVALAWLSYHAAGRFNDFSIKPRALDLLKEGKLSYSVTAPGTELGARTKPGDLTYPRRYTGLYNDDCMACMVHFSYYPNFDGSIDTFRFPLHDYFVMREETISTYQEIFNNPVRVPLGDFSKAEIQEILNRVDGDLNIQDRTEPY